MRNSIFHNLVNNEDDFTELLCNMLKFKDFETIFSKFLGIESEKIYIETQYRTKKNGRPDLVISYDDGIAFIEVKVGDTKLTNNQPEGYIRGLSSKKEQNKKLYFIVPKNYYYQDDLENRITIIKERKIDIECKNWECFFEYCKEKRIYSRDKIFNEYYTLLKSWFGYETIFFAKEEQNIMKKNGEIMDKAGKFLACISSRLGQNGYKSKWSEGPNEIGFTINKKDVYYGWVGMWFPLWKDTGNCFIYSLSDKEGKKFYNNFVNIYNYSETYEERENDTPEGKTIYRYICFDDDIFKKNIDTNIIFNELVEILNNISKRQKIK